jgi:TRAP-type C4-dicarboxylate transport system substrate-binding protein
MHPHPLRSFAARASALLALALATSPAAAQSSPTERPLELKVSVAVGPAYALGKAADRWAKRITELGSGALSAKLFPGATLAARDPSGEFAALRSGAAALAVGSTLHWSTYLEALNVVALPWLAPQPKQLEALAAGPFAERLMAVIEQAGVVPLALAPLGHRQLVVRDRNVETPSDLQRLRVRIGAPQLAGLYLALGASPRVMSFGEAQAALSAGALDAQEGPLATLAASGVDAGGLNRIVLWDATAEVAVFAANRAHWDALTEGERALIRGTAREIAAELGEQVRQENDAALTALRKRGAAAARLTAAQRAAFIAATREVYDRQAKAAGEELLRAAEETVARAAP